MKPAVVYLGLGTNVGSNLLMNLDLVFHKLVRDAKVRVLDSSHAYLSKATVLGQLEPKHGDYLNAVLKVETLLSPPLLLAYLKDLERKQFLRDPNQPRHASRTMDLDILLYGSGQRFDAPDLVIPHPRMGERDFVLLPLGDVMPRTKPLPTGVQRTVRGTVASYGPNLTWVRGEACKRVGIINATPDSFSDGGLLQTISPAERAKEMMLGGRADCLDVGGESTRPNAPPVGEQQEIDRVLPIIHSCLPYCQAISIDTTKPGVAQAALDAGCTVVNDVSGGSNTELVRLVGKTPGANLVLMHSKGTPETMDSLATAGDRDIVSTVAAELLSKVTRAVQSCQVPRWRVIIDPGIGFAKTHEQSMQLLLGADLLRRKVDGNIPVMIAHSRKRFLKTQLLGLETDAQDWPSIGAREEINFKATELAIQHGADLVRIHLANTMQQTIKGS
ncbi:dihydropteroate synthase [Batrachochytrium salamandrivorans]|nr:dihydropteroate synthase [Batrachochytrium salamandrivorans]KAH9260906.1 dihydropteroate synthase [Batrachochytrium salamandrivorans]